MQAKNAGSFLAMLRKQRHKSLQEVANQMGGKHISKQALSLIENGHMRIPAGRLRDLKNAYGLLAAEQVELDRVHAFERLVEDTGEDREFGEAVLSVVDPERSTSIYVVGGRSVNLTSPILHAKAAEFLEGPDNRLIFIYPKLVPFSAENRSVWFQNGREEMMKTLQSVQALSSHSVKNQIQFYGIDVRDGSSDPLLLQALSLCSPFTTITITSPRPGHPVAGYVHVEGPRDRWVLLRANNAKLLLDLIGLLMQKANGSVGLIKESFE
jgi:transcriptional regulator with XRE-family HTH domain